MSDSRSKLPGEQKTESKVNSQPSFSENLSNIQKVLGNKSLHKIIIQQKFNSNSSTSELLDIINSKNVKVEQEKAIESLLVEKNKSLKNEKNIGNQDKISKTDEGKNKSKLIAIEDQLQNITESFTREEILNAKVEWDNTSGKHYFHPIVSTDGELDYRPHLFFKDWESVKSNLDGYDRQDLQFVSYLVMRKAYSNDKQTLSTILSDLDTLNFFGTSVTVRKEFKSRLENVEKSLKKDTLDNQQQSINAKAGVFNPRLVRITDKTKTSTKISEHALGLAIDINVATNKFIDNQEEILVIKEVTGVNLGEKQDRETLRKASKKFSSEFNKQWKEKIKTRLNELKSKETRFKDKLNKQDEEEKSKLEHIQKAIYDRGEALDGYRKTGFFDLSDKVIEAFKKEGMEWGGSYVDKKDFHHFELKKK